MLVWKKTVCEVTLFYPSSTFGGEWCSFESDTLTWISLLSNKYPWGLNPATNYTPDSIIEIGQNTEHFSNMLNTHRKYVKCFISKKRLCNENRLEAHYQQYRPMSINEGLLPNGILPPASRVHPESSWIDYSRCTWMAIDKMSINALLIDNIRVAPPPEDKFLIVCQWGIHLVDHLITQETSIFTRSCWRTIILMILTL